MIPTKIRNTAKPEKVLAKCGLSKNFSSRKSALSRCFFNEVNLQKNYGIGKQLRQKKWSSSTLKLTPHFANTMLYAVLFCACGLEICRSSGGKFILFLVLAKRGKGNALFVFSSGKRWTKNKMCIFLCGWIFCKFDFQLWKNIVYNRKNIIYKHEHRTFKRSNINYKHENIIYKGKNITPHRANMIYKRKNIKKS